jgi:hypothetical protein
MNLFILDEDLDRCAEAHIDKHIGKMQLEAAQLLTTALWVDKYLGYVPRAFHSNELAILKEVAKHEPAINERTFTRYLPTHWNHPCNIWIRSSMDNYIWTHCYVNALNSENVWRGYKSHASCAEVNKLPDPKLLTSVGLTEFALAMPDEYKCDDAVQSYRAYYMGAKNDIATWKRRGMPSWWRGTPYQNYEASLKADEETLGRDFR